MEQKLPNRCSGNDSIILGNRCRSSCFAFALRGTCWWLRRQINIQLAIFLGPSTLVTFQSLLTSDDVVGMRTAVKHSLVFQRKNSGFYWRNISSAVVNLRAMKERPEVSLLRYRVIFQSGATERSTDTLSVAERNRERGFHLLTGSINFKSVCMDKISVSPSFYTSFPLRRPTSSMSQRLG